MYNDRNVQPQLNNTGHGGSDSGEPIAAARAGATNELPSPLSPSTVTPVASLPPAQPAPHEGTEERWAQEVEQLFSRTVNNPRQRAEEFGELRRRYLQDVAGLRPGNREESL